MEKRIIPIKIWNRGTKIANNGDVVIQYIDNDRQEVEATVFGTEAYGVTVNQNDAGSDFCECPYFPGHGYCKHIAAVVKLLKSQGRPIEQLFNDQTDDLNFPKKMGAHYLLISAKFEQQLLDHPEAAREVYANKQQYNQLRADLDGRASFFAKPVLKQALPKSALPPEFEQYRKALEPQASGEYFLEQIQLPEKHYFQPLQASTDTALHLEVTLVVGQTAADWSYQEVDRFFIKLRVAGADSKFYVVSNIDRFLAAYRNHAVYQTNGKREFQLSATAFAPTEQALLDFLKQLENEAKIDIYGASASRYMVLPTYNFAHTVALLTALPTFYFKSDEQTKRYETIKLEAFTAEAGLLSGELVANATGYNLTIKADFQSFVNSNLVLIRRNTLYQATSEQFRIIAQINDNYNEVVEYHSQRHALHFPLDSESQLSDFVTLFQQVGMIKFPPQLVVKKMIPHFDLSRDKQTLVLKLAFEYDGEITDSNDIAKNKTIVRNSEMEAQAATYLRSLEFHQHGRSWTKSFVAAEELYRFFVDELPNLRTNGVVTLTPELEALLQDSAELTPKIDVGQADGFLAVSFSFGGINENEVDQVLEQLDVAQPFIARPDGSIVLVDDELKKVAAALVKVRAQGKFKHGQMKVHASQALAIQAALGDTANFDQKFKRLTTDLAHPEQFAVAASQPVNAKLRPYQKLGVKWLEMLDSYHFGGILADEMGLGKTLQMITFLNNHLVPDQTNLVVSPASLIYNWQEEFAKFAPKIEVEVVDGTKAHRHQLIATSSAAVLITSYNSARLDIEDYQQRELNYLVLDEAQYVKNGSSKTNQNLRKLTPKNTFALSGTPIENRAEELWAIFALVMPGLLPSKKAFNKLTPDEIAVRVKPFILRREKVAVLKDLPAKVESNLYNEMTTEQKTVYLAQLKQMQITIKGMSSENFVKNKIAILAGLTRLRQICDTPALYVDDYQASSGKLDQLNEILHQAVDNQHRVLIFSQFTSMLNMIEAELAKQNIATFMLQGRTKPKERLAMVDAFNAGEKTVFLISLKAGGTGLNLTGADTVILVDLWWNPAVEDQATARAHRIGQTKKVEVYRLITKGTIEEQIYKLQEKKRNFVDQVLSGTENKGSLTEEEVRLILGIE
ncbi:helicase SNF2 [Loigolactobacillus backii]|uniref:SNF2-related protein n=1 Tax=Loigolactobacillus backii TaxID=375175 RepID=UPI0007F14A10|nr:SNF2-related protein [Loigolactobacillus backii]ANK64100.1 helicase SNF2 [Loigolactobacillus backii]